MGCTDCPGHWKGPANQGLKGRKGFILHLLFTRQRCARPFPPSPQSIIKVLSLACGVCIFHKPCAERGGKESRKDGSVYTTLSCLKKPLN